MARGEEIAPDRILLTASTSEAYAYVFKLLADAGDEVLVPRPSYPLFEFLARLESLRVVQYPLVYDGGWRIDFDALVRGGDTAHARRRARQSEQSDRLLPEDGRVAAAGGALCGAGNRHRLGRSFRGLRFRGRGRAGCAAWREAATSLTFCFSGLSKIAALPQMKLGWIVAGGPPRARRRALERLELIADTYLSVVDAGAVRRRGGCWLRARWCGPKSRRARERTSRCLRAAVAGSALDVLDVEGGWYATVRVPRTRSEEEWTLGSAGARQRAGAAGLLLRLRERGVSGAEPADRTGPICRKACGGCWFNPVSSCQLPPCGVSFQYAGPGTARTGSLRLAAA